MRLELKDLASAVSLSGSLIENCQFIYVRVKHYLFRSTGKEHC